MIIKRGFKSQMPTRKRHTLTDSDDDDCNSAHAHTKKQKKPYDFDPLNLLGEVAARIIPATFNAGTKKRGFSALRRNEASCSPAPAMPAGGQEATELPKPALVRTSRGRVQVLPSRFSDSVIDNWRKESKTSTSDCNLDEKMEHRIRKEKFSPPAQKPSSQIIVKRGRNDDHKYSKYSVLCVKKDVGENGYVGMKRFNASKYGSSQSSLMSELLVEDGEGLYQEPNDVTGLERSSKETCKRRDGLCGPEDFFSGDIVWAKSGKKEPFWPAIVIDPTTQAPALVVRACVSEAACVMFFGHSGNENQRDYAWVKRGMIVPFIDNVESLN